ncbi:MAG: class I SAM-dependent methyltransferase [Chitinophagaceae bacterium]|nr:class I SAM-dependent methyltransferase [Chitinophagaceae bacterium]
MFEFHSDKKRYFDMQAENAASYVIPFIETAFPIKPGMRVLEIGCAEGGVLKAFVDKGCIGIGVELDEPRLVLAREFLQTEIEAGKIRFISKDIYQVDLATEFQGGFDIIVLKDVIEHIHDQEKLIGWMKNFLNPGGVVFFGFPPWQMPFGGHQQICHKKWLASLPWYHLLPTPVYKWILKSNGEPWEHLLEIKETGISIERFERIVRKTGYKVIHHIPYLVNPIYRYKFGWKARKQNAVIRGIPWLRNFVTTCVYYLIQVK